jgi:hypothetical protein
LYKRIPYDKTAGELIEPVEKFLANSGVAGADLEVLLIKLT